MIRRFLLALSLLALVVVSAHAQSLNAKDLHGRYTASFLGDQSGGSNSRNLPAAESGALISDGKGNLTGFLDFDFDGFVAACSISGSYTVGSDPIGGVDGFVVLNLQFPDCENVSCPGNPPACAADPASKFIGLPEQEWCALSGEGGHALDCTLMGEIGFPNNPNTQTLIYPVHWQRQN